jgi:uncharacterized membrane protein YhaH (DUF805 family)
MDEPESATATASPSEPPARSAMRDGFWWAWVIAIGSSVLAGALAFAIGQAHLGGDTALIVGALPPLALLGLLVGTWFGEHRAMAHGVLAAFGTMFALLLLGMAACFGLAGAGGFA